MNGRAL
ncbi:hypothetical protein D047_2649A, partial [Vibrio parahaemolyticus VPTS-2010_2]